MPTLLSDFHTSSLPLPEFLAGRSDWMRQRSNYERWYAHYTGESLRLRVEDQNPFPLRINPFRYFCHIHAALTLGVPGNTEAPFRFWVESLEVREGARADDRVEEVYPGRLLMNIWKESGMNRIAEQMANWMQVYGGVYLRVVIDPRYVNNIRIEAIRPDFVYPVFGTEGLEEVYIVQPIDAIEARRLGYVSAEKAQVGAETFYRVEHWTRELWEVRVGSFLDLQVAYDREQKVLRGENPFRLYREPVIPMAYASRFPAHVYGISLIEDIIGLVEELNLRMAAVGQVIGDYGPPAIVAFNWYGPRAPDGRIAIRRNAYEFIDGGLAAPGAQEQRIEVVPASNVPASHMEFLSGIQEYLFDATMTSPVVLGHDTGSQRSAETLAVRALPTAAAVNHYRNMLADALHYTNQLALVGYQLSVPPVLRKRLAPAEAYRIHTSFLPPFPKDQAAEIQAIALLRQVGLRSRPTALRELGDVTDITSEVELLREEAIEQAILEALKTLLRPEPNPSSFSQAGSS